MAILYPSPIENAAKPIEEAPFVCASCGSVITARPVPSCSRCKVTTYCGRDCQIAHWKKGGHKKACRKKGDESSTTSGCDDSERRSFLFNIDDAVHLLQPGQVVQNFNHNTGSVSYTGSTREQTAELASVISKGPTTHGVNFRTTADARNIYGNQEFIVKLQPPATFGGYHQGGLPESPWMCYDQARSFEAYIPATTPGLAEAYALLQRKGIKSSNPMTGQNGYKAYAKARWEASNIRVYYDRLLPKQPW